MTALPQADFLDKLPMTVAKELAPLLLMSDTEIEEVYREEPEELKRDAIKARGAMAGYRIVAAVLSGLSDRLTDVAERHGFEFE